MARFDEGNMARELFNDDLDSGKPRFKSVDSFKSVFEVYMNAVEDALDDLAQGKRPYKTARNLNDKGKKLDAKIDMKYDKNKQVIGYDITLDEDIEKHRK